MSGLCRHTGKPISAWEHTVQSIAEEIVPTPYGARVQREDFGSPVPAIIIRRNISNDTLLGYAWAVALACELWEPRFRVKKLVPQDVPEERRKGQTQFHIIGAFMPRAHLGDFTVEGERSFLLG
ncbi:hypothetical protein [Pseudovibrio sp. Tun.PSC04-5.I4]|uniref:hypothetical protein n=1 Tax=Pseudovibrio sp. Tun.PSC04-5.I4 TaxID=1798213 RepID=UPI00088B81EC|nr:hypothetical protein [Pseudovibrio sp. Tun.PSC04-5.I4]SDQ99760.1 hypothetical protein SAMN04515695_2237 [Pseudovibrio sp. Tun.PSC04-5.I4]